MMDKLTRKKIKSICNSADLYNFTHLCAKTFIVLNLHIQNVLFYSNNTYDSSLLLFILGDPASQEVQTLWICRVSIVHNLVCT